MLLNVCILELTLFKEPSLDCLSSSSSANSELTGFWASRKGVTEGGIYIVHDHDNCIVYLILDY